MSAAVEDEGLARRVAAACAKLPEVVAVALGGSLATGAADDGSDVDLYVYARVEPPLAARAALLAGAPRAELGNRAFEPGDEWVDPASGRHVDVMFRTPAFVEEDLERVLVRHEPRTGYTTALWHGVRVSRPLLDPTGWYAALSARAAAPYPEPLVAAIVARNAPLLRRGLSSFARQLEKAAARGDAVAVNHRVAAFLASLFDVLFAVNRETHPGEKRLLALAEARCARRPPGLAEGVRALLAAAAPGTADVAARADALAADVEGWLAREGLWP